MKKMVISDKILVFIATPKVKWQPVTGFAYESVLIYIVVMRQDLPHQESTSFNQSQVIFKITPIKKIMSPSTEATKSATPGVPVWAW